MFAQYIPPFFAHHAFQLQTNLEHWI